RTGATLHEAATTSARTTEWRISAFTITPPRFVADDDVVARSYGRSGVAEHVERFRPQIRKHQMPGKHAYALKAAFLEDATRRLMVDVAQGIHARDLELSRQGDHRAKRLGCVPLAPGVAREHISGRGAIRGFHHDARASQQRTARFVESQQWP